MHSEASTAGWVGITLGAMALLLALVHFYAGPFTPQPRIEDVVANKAVAIKQAAVAALKGEKLAPREAPKRFDADRIAQTAVAVMGGASVVFAVIGFVRRESLRAAVGAACLGAAALAFQFLAIALGVIVLAILVSAAVGTLGVS